MEDIYDMFDAVLGREPTLIELQVILGLMMDGYSADITGYLEELKDSEKED